MTKRTLMLLTLLAAFDSAAALAKEDAMHCQARTLRCESEYFQCLSRCDRRDARDAAQGRPAAAAGASDCEARCEQRHDSSMARIASTPPCAAVIAEPDPSACEARLLRIGANRLVCESRCARRDGKRFDAEACLARCETRCGTAYDAAMAQDDCSAGRIGDTTVCADQ